MPAQHTPTTINNKRDLAENETIKSELLLMLSAATVVRKNRILLAGLRVERPQELAESGVAHVDPVLIPLARHSSFLENGRCCPRNVNETTEDSEELFFGQLGDECEKRGRTAMTAKPRTFPDWNLAPIRPRMN